MAIPPKAFVVRKRWARLHLPRLPLCDSFFFGNCQGVASTVDTTVEWKATTGRIKRGLGKSVEPTDPGAFVGGLSVANCTGTVRGSQTGFDFHTVGTLDASGFFAEFGWEANGAFL